MEGTVTGVGVGISQVDVPARRGCRFVESLAELNGQRRVFPLWVLPSVIDATGNNTRGTDYRQLISQLPITDSLNN